LPNELQEKSELNKEGNSKEIDIELLFKDIDDIYEYNGYFNYWRYEGSLTYPPCDGNL
jgi:carbonic anhydrase